MAVRWVKSILRVMKLYLIRSSKWCSVPLANGSKWHTTSICIPFKMASPLPCCLQSRCVFMVVICRFISINMWIHTCFRAREMDNDFYCDLNLENTEFFHQERPKIMTHVIKIEPADNVSWKFYVKFSKSTIEKHLFIWTLLVTEFIHYMICCIMYPLNKSCIHELHVLCYDL